MYLIFDTETTGKTRSKNALVSDSDNWPRVVQIAWQLHDKWGKMIEHQDFLITPSDFTIPYEAEKIHGISTALAQRDGKLLSWVLEEFSLALSKVEYVVGHNIIGFDINIMRAEYYRLNMKDPLENFPILDTCTEITAELCQLPGGRGGKYKLPTLTELNAHLFGVPFAEAHNATADVEATTRCFFELIRIGKGLEPELLTETYIKEFRLINPEPIASYGLQHINLKKASESIISEEDVSRSVSISEQDKIRLENATFVHLHNHSQFSILQSTTSITALVEASAKEGFPAVALTDMSNMMGVFHFVKEVNAYNKKVDIKNQENIQKGESSMMKPLIPIVGCELYVCENMYDRTQKDNGFLMVFLAKNKKGYHNLVKLTSYAHTQGYYYVPRIDKRLLLEYKDDLIVLSGGLQGELYSKILNLGEKQATEALLWWKEHFKDDFYIEMVNHGQENEHRANKFLIELAIAYQVKLIATNNTFYISKTDANAHDILLCLKEGEKQATPIGQGRGYRYGMPNQEYYFKNSTQMKEIFKDVPSAIWNIQEVIDKIEPYKLSRDVLLPKFEIPSEFLVEDDATGKKGENKYLKYLTFQGAKKRYPQMSAQVEERLLFELSIIEKTGYPGYFLIVQDFIAAAKEMGVSVGPGRGSAAGSAVAYCLGITNVDPIAYDLLFERFLNPDRVSMPDIDIDFEDDGRGKVMDYVINKYGANQVAQIITYGTMAAKSSLKDAARVLDLPLYESERIAKLIPNMKLDKIFSASEETLKQKLRAEEIEKVHQLITHSKEKGLVGEVINQAKILEGSIRNTGIHACGVIITPDDITNFVPVSTAGKDSQLWVTQFDNSVAESAGLLKMDFLGLKTLTLIKDSVALIEKRHGIKIDSDLIPLDDPKTYELFQRGETVGIFQYESVGMQKYMRELRPTVFADLIAMNALYRPGPLEYIPSFIRRKHGLEPIVYDLDAMEEYLKETYGITVYQEQVMLLSQKLAGFTKGEADMLRKAMGKKQKDVLDKMKPQFVKQAQERGYDAQKLEKIWRDWEAFASYAFNKSHSTCYAWIGYQTAYLKANYPAEYMAAVLSNNMNDIKSVTFFLEECKRMGIKVLSPDVNESTYKFTVNKEGHIRLGLGAIKGVGKAAVDSIVQERLKGQYESVFDFLCRVDLRSVNKKTFESLIISGCFDSFEELHRALFFHQEQGENISFLEKMLRYGAKTQEMKNSKQLSLFGDSKEVQMPEPKLPNVPHWSMMERLRREKEVVGIYISGHPLDDFKYPMEYFINKSVTELSDLENIEGEVCFGGMLTNVEHLTSAAGRGFAKFSIEDYSGQHQFAIYGQEYEKLRSKLIENTMIYIKAIVKYGFQRGGTPPRKMLQYIQIGYLSDMLSEVKSLSFGLPIGQISPSKKDFFSQFLKNNKGNVPVQFEIFSGDNTLSLAMTPMASRISITPESLDEITNQGIIYRINGINKWYNKPNILKEEQSEEREEENISNLMLLEQE